MKMCVPDEGSECIKGIDDCAFLGLDVEEHLQLIGYFLELFFVVCCICGGPVGWRFRKTSSCWSLTKLCTSIEKPICWWRCSVGAWFRRGVRVRTRTTRLYASRWTIASPCTRIRNGNGLSSWCPAGPIGGNSRSRLAWDGHVLHWIACRRRAGTASSDPTVLKATLGGNHDSHYFFFLDFSYKLQTSGIVPLAPFDPDYTT